MGTADLGLEVQLKEIEQGLMDLLAARPQGEAMKREELGACWLPTSRVEAAVAELRWRGRVTQVIGPLVESEGPFCSVGEVCEITDSQGRTLPGEVVGFRGTTVLSMPLESPRGVRHGDRVSTWGERPTIRVGDGLLGRVIDGGGEAA